MTLLKQLNSFIIISISLFSLSCVVVDAAFADDIYQTRDDCEILGFSVHTYFQPNSSHVSKDCESVNLVIEFQGDFTGYYFSYTIRPHGSREKGVNDAYYFEIRGQEEYFDSNTSFVHKEFAIPVPESSNFIVSAIITYNWVNILLRGDNRDVFLEASYTRLSSQFSLEEAINFIIFVLIPLIIIGGVIILKFPYSSQSKTSKRYYAMKQYLYNHTNYHGKYSMKDQGLLNDLKPGGLVPLIMHETELSNSLATKSAELEKLQSSIDKIKKLESQIKTNQLMKIILSNFDHATQNRELYYRKVDNLEQIKFLRRSLAEKDWTSFQDSSTIILAVKLCESYLLKYRPSQSEDLANITDISVQSTTLSHLIQEFYQTKNRVAYNQSAKIEKLTNNIQSLTNEKAIFTKQFELVQQTINNKRQRYLNNWQKTLSQIKKYKEKIQDKDLSIDPTEKRKTLQDLKKMQKRIDREIKYINNLI